uniref:Sushi domain-containing protein n=1 Tax=Ascaris lumbricoides TaxID=6252 RepID=A0A0M3HW65_ASCLU
LDKIICVRFTEERTIDCTSPELKDDCILVAPNAKTYRDPAKYKCRREPMPQNNWNTLARNSTTRLSCPIGCEPDADLSVLVKTPRNNRLCQKYYTYGKYRDVKEKEWYLWLTEPCRANITTWCRFRDIPLAQAKTKTAWRQENRVQKGLRFEDTQPVRIAVEVQ